MRRGGRGRWDGRVGGHEAEQCGATGRESVRVGGRRWNGMKWNDIVGVVTRFPGGFVTENESIQRIDESRNCEKRSDGME